MDAVFVGLAAVVFLVALAWLTRRKKFFSEPSDSEKLRRVLFNDLDGGRGRKRAVSLRQLAQMLNKSSPRSQRTRMALAVELRNRGFVASRAFRGIPKVVYLYNAPVPAVTA